MAAFFSAALAFSTAIIFPIAGTAAEKNEKTEKNKAPLISQKVYKLLTEAQNLVSAKKYQQALTILDKIKSRKRLNRTEKAQLWNFYAYVYFTTEKYGKAIQAYETLLKQPELQEGLRTGTLYTLSQLYFLQEDYRSALDKIQEWMRLTDKPSPEAYALLGQAYYKLAKYKKAIPAIKKAIGLRQQNAKQPKESWYLLLRASFYELKDLANMEKVVKDLIRLYPKEQYIRDLMGIYSQMGKNKKQLALMEILYEKDLLNKPSQFRNLASLYIIHGIPYKAAKVLETAIQKGRIPKNQKTLELLSQAWVQAREDRKALKPLTEAARLSGKGEAWVRVGRAHANLDQWKEAIKALQTALKKNDIKNPDAAWILLGMGYYNLGILHEAKQAFSKAANMRRSSPQNKRTAKQWVKYLDSEIERQRAISAPLTEQNSSRGQNFEPKVAYRN